MQHSSKASDASDASRKRPASEGEGRHHTKRAKYTSAAWYVLKIISNECKRCKIKCIRLDGDADCQRCTTVQVACVVVPTAAQSAKETNKEGLNSRSEE
jgi:hypothetical protein